MEALCCGPSALTRRWKCRGTARQPAGSKQRISLGSVVLPGVQLCAGTLPVGRRWRGSPLQDPAHGGAITGAKPGFTSQDPRPCIQPRQPSAEPVLLTAQCCGDAEPHRSPKRMEKPGTGTHRQHQRAGNSHFTDGNCFALTFKKEGRGRGNNYNFFVHYSCT